MAGVVYLELVMGLGEGEGAAALNVYVEGGQRGRNDRADAELAGGKQDNCMITRNVSGGSWRQRDNYLITLDSAK